MGTGETLILEKDSMFTIMGVTSADQVFTAVEINPLLSNLVFLQFLRRERWKGVRGSLAFN